MIYKNNKFLTNHLDKLSLDKIFYKIVYHHIIYLYFYFSDKLVWKLEELLLAYDER